MKVSEWLFSEKSPVLIEYSFEMEQRLAAQWSGYTWNGYCALPGTDTWVSEMGGDSKCAVIVTYRHSKLMEAIMNDAQSKRVK